MAREPVMMKLKALLAVLLLVLCTGAFSHVIMMQMMGAPPPAAGGATIEDDFSSDTSSDYSTIDGGITISGGTAGGSRGDWAYDGVVHDTTLGTDDHYVQMDCVWHVHESDLVTPAFNVTPGATPDTTATGYFINIYSTGGDLNEFSSGSISDSWQDSDTWNGGEGPWTAGDTHLCRAGNDGSGNITLDVDWDDDGSFSGTDLGALEYTDTTLTGNYIGIVWKSEATARRTDNLEADAN